MNKVKSRPVPRLTSFPSFYISFIKTVFLISYEFSVFQYVSWYSVFRLSNDFSVLPMSFAFFQCLFD